MEATILGAGVTLALLALLIPTVLVNNLLQAIPLNYCARKVRGINSNYLKCFSILNLAALVYLLALLPLLLILPLFKQWHPVFGGLLWICLANFFYLGIWLWSARLLWDCRLRLAAKASLPVAVFVGVISDFFLAEIAFLPFYPSMVVWAVVCSMGMYIVAFFWAYSGSSGQISVESGDALVASKLVVKRKSGELGVSPWPLEAQSKKGGRGVKSFQLTPKFQSARPPRNGMDWLLLLVIIISAVMAVLSLHVTLRAFGFF
jgi:hypothetical protein